MGVRGEGTFIGGHFSGSQALVVRGSACCNGTNTFNYAAMIDNYASGADPDVLGLLIGKPAVTSDMNFIAFFLHDEPQQQIRLVGEIEGDGANWLPVDGSGSC